MPGTVGHRISDFARFVSQRRQVRPEQFDRDLRARAGKQVVDAMRNRLADFGSYAGNASEFLPHFFHHFRMWTIAFFRDDFDLACVDSRRVFIEFGTSRAACRRNDFRNFMQRHLDDLPNAI